MGLLMVKKLILLVGVVAVISLLSLPYVIGRTNPPVRAEPKWDSPRTRELVVRACFDCHSNETVWPWYSYVPLISGKIVETVAEGREELNYSEWDRPQKEADESAESVVEGEMPPLNYVWLHPKAWLTDGEKKELVRGLEVTFGSEDREREGKRRGRGKRGRRGRDDDDGSSRRGRD